jgi:hypothetical protein
LEFIVRCKDKKTTIRYKPEDKDVIFEHWYAELIFWGKVDLRFEDFPNLGQESWWAELIYTANPGCADPIKMRMDGVFIELFRDGTTAPRQAADVIWMYRKSGWTLIHRR